MKGSIPLTQEGYRKLQNELRQLEHEQWPDVLKEIEEARAHGDLSENAEYQYAKEKQGQLDAKIRKLKDMLSRAEVIDPAKMAGENAAFGATVTAKNLETDQEVKYLLIGPEEADAAVGRISIQSPIGRAFVGKKTGDEIQVETPGGIRSFRILKITWGA
jgi:transcription elongation factor GreA